MLRKCFQCWQFWLQAKQDRRELEEAQSQTRHKMIAFLEAAAAGKLWNNGKTEETKEELENGRGDDSGSRPGSVMRKLVCYLCLPFPHSVQIISGGINHMTTVN